jgi:cellulose synthase operon protein C
MAQAYRRKDYGACVAMAERREATGRIEAAVSLQKGWCLMALNRPQEAVRAFAAAADGRASASDAAYGEALAHLRSGDSMEAVMAANAAPLSIRRRNEIGVAVMAQQASEAFDRGSYRATLDILNRRRMFTPEPRDLSMLRGWSLFHLARKDEAKTVFGTLDQQLSTRDSQAGFAAASEPRH